MSIVAIPALGDPRSRVVAGAGPRAVSILEIPVPFEVYRGKEVLATYRRRQVAVQIARALGPGFKVRVRR